MTDLPSTETTDANPIRSNRNDADIDTVCAVRIKTGARLHFGLLDTVLPFGGVGVMIDQPSHEIVVTSAESFECDPALRDRFWPIAKRISIAAGLPGLPAIKVVAEQQIRSHCGLGSGTQLALAAAESMSVSIGLPTKPEFLAVQLADRGKRSTVGVHGYFHGGLILESGHDDERLNPIEFRVELPTQWHVAIFQPASKIDPISGSREREHFLSLAAANKWVRDGLLERACKIMHTAQQADFDEFVDSVQQYNYQSGLLFETIQGGPYNGPEIANLVDTLSHLGARGIGQSSWGPGVFAWFQSQLQAECFCERLPQHINKIAIAAPMNTGRQCLS